MTATVPSVLSSKTRPAIVPSRRIVLPARWLLTLGLGAPVWFGRDASSPHHIDNARREAEQQEHNHPPRRDPEQPIKRPADPGADPDAGHELAGEPKSARISGCIGGRSTSARFGRFARPLPVDLIAETPEPRGESSLVSTLSRIVVVARVIGHLDATPAPLMIGFPAPSRPRGPYLLGQA